MTEMDGAESGRMMELGKSTMWRLTSFRGALIVLLASLVAGCATGRPLMPTPGIYTDQKGSYFTDVPASLRTPEVDIMFATDRQPEEDESGQLRYGFQRSESMAFGSVKVNLGHDLTWGELVNESETSNRDRPMELSLGPIEEIGRFPPTPAPYRVIDGSITVSPEYRAKSNEVGDQLRSEIRRRLASTPRKEVFIYVHGYNDTFQDAVFVGGEFWHFLGREGVPIVYSWPAGYPGLFGYTYDRESSEYTVLHFKQLVSLVSEMPEVKALHIVAHSRGADVVAAGIRELFIYTDGAGIHPLKRYKIQNIVLAAPDLDVGVVQQRVAGEKVLHGVGHFTMYSSPADEAIGIAEMLFASPRGRLGKLDQAKLSVKDKESIRERAAKRSLIRFEGGVSDKYGHSYFRMNPGVSSDIVLLLRYEFAPGTPERPLVPLAPGFWKIPPGYPNNSEK